MPEPDQTRESSLVPDVTEPKSANTWVKADALARADHVWALRVAGHTWRHAAEVVGYSSPQAAMAAVRKQYGEVPRLDREDLRNLWRERLEVTWQHVLNDMGDQKPGAVTAAVRVMQAAAALDGLNEAVRVDLSVSETFKMITEEMNRNDL